MGGRLMVLELKIRVQQSSSSNQRLQKRDGGVDFSFTTILGSQKDVLAIFPNSYDISDETSIDVNTMYTSTCGERKKREIN